MSEKGNPKECAFYEGKMENDVCIVDQYPVATIDRSSKYVTS